MLVGHIAVGLAAKPLAPRVSLGTLVAAALLPDLLWCAFLLTGIEHVSLAPGRGAVNYLALSDVAFSHSLLMDAVWGALFAGIYYLLRHDVRGAQLLFAAVVSHWLLDFVAHRPDMPLAPGIHRVFGLGLWNSVSATIVVEGGMWVAAIIIYIRSTHAKNWPRVAFWIVAAFVTLAWYGNLTGSPPPDARSMAISSLIFFALLVGLACYNSM